MTVVLQVAGALFLLTSAASWINAWRVNGPFSWRVPLTMLRVASQSNLLFLLASIAAAVGATIGNLAGLDLYPQPPWPLLVGIIAVSFTRAAVPASILLLGYSTNATVDFYDELVRAGQPLRTVHMLKLDLMALGPFRGMHLRNSQARIQRGRPWDVVVGELMAMVPIVLLDTRIMSGPIAYETQRVLGSDRLRRKTIFIADLHRLDPSLLAGHPAASAPICVVAPEITQSLLGQRCAQLRRLDPRRVAGS